MIGGKHNVTQTAIIEPLYLSDVSPRDYKWDLHQVNTHEVAGYYKNSDFIDYYKRLNVCAVSLTFRVVVDELRLNAANFCRVRYCPICQWRRSLKWKAKAYRVLPRIIEQFPNHRWIFLTLTVRNCDIAQLLPTISWMHHGFSTLTKRKAWSPEGWVRSTEVTRSATGQAHPHIHCLLMVSPDYFDDKAQYLHQSQWAAEWASVLGLDYLPVVDVRAIPRGISPAVVVPEIFKYQTKAGHLLADRDWFLELSTQMKGIRMIAPGGVLRSQLRDLKDEQADLLFINDDEESADFTNNCPEIPFMWNPWEKRYEAWVD
jgi:hypothetical protein